MEKSKPLDDKCLIPGNKEYEELLEKIFGKRVLAVGKRPAGRMRPKKPIKMYSNNLMKNIEKPFKPLIEKLKPIDDSGVVIICPFCSREQPYVAGTECYICICNPDAEIGLMVKND